MRTGLIAAIVALTALPAFAQDQPLQLQWKRVPDVSMRQLVDEGYDIKSVLADRTDLADGRFDTLTYILQRGADTYRCIEGGVLDKNGGLQSQVIYCSVLVEPYDGKAKAAG
ncbi:MAG TPA: hypothetical protein VGM83_19165 [Devosiaceae bacterium]|jgi:hypothetical protein